MSDDRLDEERGGWLTLMEAKDAEIARLTAELGHWQRVFGDDAFALVQRAEAERDEAIGLLREITDEIDFEARPPYRHDLYLAATAFLARVGKEQK
jgi:hypothetical protein